MDEYEQFASKFEISDEVGEDRGSLMEALARLLIDMAENEQRQGGVA